MSFPDVNKAIEMFEQIQSNETKNALESALDADAMMNYYISTRWLFIIDKDSMSVITPKHFIDEMTLGLDDPSFSVTLDFSDPSSILLEVTKQYGEDVNPDESYALIATILLRDFGFHLPLIESDLSYDFVVDGNIEVIPTFSSSVSSSLSQSLGIDFQLEVDSVIFCYFFLIFRHTSNLRYYQIFSLTSINDIVFFHIGLRARVVSNLKYIEKT